MAISNIIEYTEDGSFGWNDLSEEEKYAEWSQYFNMKTLGHKMSYVDYCNQWDAVRAKWEHEHPNA